jgi:hypothetical protein
VAANPAKTDRFWRVDGKHLTIELSVPALDGPPPYRELMPTDRLNIIGEKPYGKPFPIGHCLPNRFDRMRKVLFR